MNHNLTIATWNLNRAPSTLNARSKALLEHIEAVNADIWVLTETHECFTLPGYKPLSTPMTARRAPGQRTTMIWVREDWAAQEVPVFPDLPKREEPARTWPSFTVSSRDTSPAVCTLVEMPIGKVLVYGTVITYYADRGPWGTSPNNQEQLRSTEAHHRDWRRLREAYPELPFITAGDFDATCDARNYPTQPTCHELRAALADSGLICLTKDLWIDHICVSAEHWEAREVRSEHPTYFSPWSNAEVKLSDHQWVAATISLSGS